MSVMSDTLASGAGTSVCRMRTPCGAVPHARGFAPSLAKSADVSGMPLVNADWAMHITETPCCGICESRHVEPLTQIGRIGAERWFNCESCGHAFTAPDDADPFIDFRRILRTFSFLDLSSEERACWPDAD